MSLKHPVIDMTKWVPPYSETEEINFLRALAGLATVSRAANGGKWTSVSYNRDGFLRQAVIILNDYRRYDKGVNVDAVRHAVAEIIAEQGWSQYLPEASVACVDCACVTLLAERHHIDGRIYCAGCWKARQA